MSDDTTSKKESPPKRMKLWNPALDDSTSYSSKSAETNLLENQEKLLKSIQSDMLSANHAQFYNPYLHFAPLLANFQPPPKKVANFYATPPIVADAFPPIRSLNPLVASALGRPVDTLNQNCCAMCGASFRLTGDLVQHMRTNHRNPKIKRADGKKKAESGRDKGHSLCCPICEEVFADQHHLARHVQAHELQ